MSDTLRHRLTAPSRVLIVIKTPIFLVVVALKRLQLETQNPHSLEVMPGLALVIMTMTMTKKGGRKSGLTFLVREIDFFWQGVVSQS